MTSLRTALAFRSYRAASEDRGAVVPRADGVVLVVADGVGGRPGGGRAADEAVRLVAAAVPAVGRPADPEAWRDVLFDADRVLSKDPAAGETTCVVVAVTAGGVAGAAVGDSEAWLVDRAGIGPAGARGARGITMLTPQHRRKPYLGVGQSFPMGFRAAGMGKGTLLVASDGLFKYADAEWVCAAARGEDLAAAAEALAELPRNSGGSFYDDVVVAVCRPSVGQ